MHVATKSMKDLYAKYPKFHVKIDNDMIDKNLLYERFGIRLYKLRRSLQYDDLDGEQGTQ